MSSRNCRYQRLLPSLLLLTPEIGGQCSSQSLIKHLSFFWAVEEGSPCHQMLTRAGKHTHTHRHTQAESSHFCIHSSGISTDTLRGHGCTSDGFSFRDHTRRPRSLNCPHSFLLCFSSRRSSSHQNCHAEWPQMCFFTSLCLHLCFLAEWMIAGKKKKREMIK